MPESTKETRFVIFLERLAAKPSARTAQEALALLSGVLNEVEDELTEIPFDPGASATDGRMYPPQEDHARDVPERHDLVRYRSRGHNTYIRNNGAIEIQDLKKRVVFQKPGYDGAGVALNDQ